jgi:ribosomal protein S25
LFTKFEFTTSKKKKTDDEKKKRKNKMKQRGRETFRHAVPLDEEGNIDESTPKVLQIGTWQITDRTWV